MRFRALTLPAGVLAVTAMLLLTRCCWAHWYALGPSKDEWGLKYDGKLEAAGGNTLTVHFTIADQGKLKPIHSVFVMAFSNPDRTGVQLAKTPISMKPTEDGKLTGQGEVRKELIDRAMVRIFTMTVNGQSQMTGPTAGARYYDIPLKKFVQKAPPGTSSPPRASIAIPPAPNAAK